MSTNKLIQKERYKFAEKRVKRLKGLYSHALVFAVINIIIVVINIQDLSNGESYFHWHNFITFSIWGIILLSHGCSVFLPHLIFGKEWEARKIKKIMENDNSHWI